MSEKALKSIFEQQDMQEQTEKSNNELMTLLCFRVNGRDFYSHLDVVKEVMEMIPITPYPVDINGHIGIINVRGRIIPLICLFNESPEGRLDFSESQRESLNNKKFRIIIFEGEEGEPFAIIAQNVMKNVIDRVRGVEQEAVLNIRDTPYKYFDPCSFLEWRIDTEGRNS